MRTVSVTVRKSGRAIDTVERPLRYAEGGPAVVFKKQFWRYADGGIDLDSQPLDPDLMDGDRTGPVQQDLLDGSAAPQVDDSADREAIRTAGASVRMLVEAGPGTGKTEMAAQRLAGLIRSELSPGQILVLSFSRSAVRTLMRRLTRVGQTDDRMVEELRHVSIRTFDSWAFRMLRLMGRSPSALLARPYDENIAELTSLIRGAARDEVRRFVGDRRHLIVDEFQDLPGVRGELVLALLDLLAPPRGRGCGFTILGDPAQAIYGFAGRHEGASYPGPAEYWRRVIDTYGEELQQLTLRRNYRAEASLADLSAELRRVLLSDRPADEKLSILQAALAGLPPPEQEAGPAWLKETPGGSRAILTRTNGEALRVLQTLFGREVEGPPHPVRLRAGSYASLPPAWIAALLRRMKTPALTRSQFTRIYSHLTGQWDTDTRRQLGLPGEDAAWARLALASGAADDATAMQLPELRARLNWPDAFPDDQPVADDGIVVTTIHQSKGMEFDIVTVLDTGGDENGADDEAEPDDAAEQASVVYVAVTRAGRALNRIDSAAIHSAPVSRTFQGGRERLCRWWNGWVNIELGLRGDLDPLGFADPALHGGAAGVEDLQGFLLRGARTLEGHKVMLCRQWEDGRAFWTVHLQNGNTPDRLIGRTANQVTYDLLHLLHGKGYALPRTIMNLRIAAVGTVSSEAEFPLEDPDRLSRLWLGVSLFGTGDFKTLRKKSDA